MKCAHSGKLVMLCCSHVSRMLNFDSIINTNTRQCTYFVTLWCVLNTITA
jgi:hypothetical protein